MLKCYSEQCLQRLNEWVFFHKKKAIPLYKAGCFKTSEYLSFEAVMQCPLQLGIEFLLIFVSFDQFSGHIFYNSSYRWTIFVSCSSMFIFTSCFKNRSTLRFVSSDNIKYKKHPYLSRLIQHMSYCCSNINSLNAV